MDFLNSSAWLAIGAIATVLAYLDFFGIRTWLARKFAGRSETTHLMQPMTVEATDRGMLGAAVAGTAASVVMHELMTDSDPGAADIADFGDVADPGDLPDAPSDIWDAFGDLGG